MRRHGIVLSLSLSMGVLFVGCRSGCPSERSLVKTQLTDVARALSIHRLCTGRFPSTAEGLEALVRPAGRCDHPLRALIDDPWGAPFSYRSDGRRFRLASTGADRIPDTADDIVYDGALASE